MYAIRSYYVIFCSAPPLYKTPGNSTIAAVPFWANHDNICIVNAKSAFDAGANTPAGAYLGSFINNGLFLPSQLIEYGGFDTIASNGSSSQCFGSIRVFV